MAKDLGTGNWLLMARGADAAAPVAASIEVLIRGAGPDAIDCLQGPIGQLTVEWGPEALTVWVHRAGVARVLKARSVFVHEPIPLLYDALPLAKFDADARRFWRRIFRLMRVPGGRWLVRLMARRKRR